jgi:DNA end-binding protein Ku
MSARSIWSGTVSFGLVTVPVKMFTAVQPSSVKFNQLNSATGARVRQKRVDESTGDEVQYESIVKGYEISPDRFITITSEELESVSPERTKEIHLTDFVPTEQIDPMLVDKEYHLGPGTGGARAYKLLVGALQKTGLSAVGKVVIRSVERLAVLTAGEDGVLECLTLVYASEVAPKPEIDTSVEPSEAEVGMAVRLVEALRSDFDHARYEDTYRKAVLEMIERKAEGLPDPEPTPESAPEPTGDLMAALEASLQEMRSEPATESVPETA